MGVPQMGIPQMGGTPNGLPPQKEGTLKKNKNQVLSSDMFASVWNVLCIPQISGLPALGPTIKRLQIPRSVFLPGLLRVEEIKKTFLAEMG